jgi:hypothetical protein
VDGLGAETPNSTREANQSRGVRSNALNGSPLHTVTDLGSLADSAGGERRGYLTSQRDGSERDESSYVTAVLLERGTSGWLVRVLTRCTESARDGSGESSEPCLWKLRRSLKRITSILEGK